MPSLQVPGAVLEPCEVGVLKILRPLHLYGNDLIPMFDYKVHLPPCIGAPEIELIPCPSKGYELSQFRGRPCLDHAADPALPLEGLPVLDRREMAGHAAVAEVELRHLYQALADVHEIGSQEIYLVCDLEEVHVSFERTERQAHLPRYLREVDHLPCPE